MANEISKPPTQAQPQMIPLSKIHELPGVFSPKPQDKTLGSMVLSIEGSGVKEAVILRQRDDGEYQLLSGYRRRRASELAKKQDIPAHVYGMTMQEAIAYRKAVRQDPDAPIPGKLLVPSTDKNKAKVDETPTAPGDKGKVDEAPTASSDKVKEVKKPATPGDKAKGGEKSTAPSDKATEGEKPAVPGDKGKSDETPTTSSDKAKEDEKSTAPSDKGKGDEAPTAPGDKPKGNETPTAPGDKAKENEKPVALGDKTKGDETPTAPSDQAKEGEKPAAPGDKDKSDETPTAPGDRAKGDEAPSAPGDKGKAVTAAKDQPNQSTAEDKGKSAGTALPAADGGDRGKGTETPSQTMADQPAPDKDKETGEVLTAAREGPSGTSITQIFEKRLTPPDEASRKRLPAPKEGESFFITLHPAYLEKSVFNNFSVDTESENFREFLKSIELVGIKDPVLARFNQEGKLEILSGQRRHLAATMLNQAVPTIIQKIDDADAKIIVADSNLHRDKISSYDLSRALRMKMEGMKQKAGRRKKGYSANELQSDVKLAQEMGMSVSKLNRLIRMSEAVKGVCDLVDEGRLTVSVAAEMSALKPMTQEAVLHLLDLGYKATNERISRMKKAEGGGKKLDEMTLRNILDDKDIAPKQPEPVRQPETPAPTAGGAPKTSGEAVSQPPIPASPDVPAAPDTPLAADVPPWEGPERSPSPKPGAGQPVPAASAPEKDDNPLKGPQERPEVTKVILTGDRLRKYFPDVSMTPREIEESVYSALEERRQRQMKEQQKAAIFKRSGGQAR